MSLNFGSAITVTTAPVEDTVPTDHAVSGFQLGMRQVAENDVSWYVDILPGPGGGTNEEPWYDPSAGPTYADQHPVGIRCGGAITGLGGDAAEEYSFAHYKHGFNDVIEYGVGYGIGYGYDFGFYFEGNPILAWSTRMFGYLAPRRNLDHPYGGFFGRIQGTLNMQGFSEQRLRGLGNFSGEPMGTQGFGRGIPPMPIHVVMFLVRTVDPGCFDLHYAGGEFLFEADMAYGAGNTPPSIPVDVTFSAEPYEAIWIGAQITAWHYTADHPVSEAIVWWENADPHDAGQTPDPIWLEGSGGRPGGTCPLDDNFDRVVPFWQHRGFEGFTTSDPNDNAWEGWGNHWYLGIGTATGTDPVGGAGVDGSVAYLELHYGTYPDRDFFAEAIYPLAGSDPADGIPAHLRMESVWRITRSNADDYEMFAGFLLGGPEVDLNFYWDTGVFYAKIGIYEDFELDVDLPGWGWGVWMKLIYERQAGGVARLKCFPASDPEPGAWLVSQATLPDWDAQLNQLEPTLEFSVNSRDFVDLPPADYARFEVDSISLCDLGGAPLGGGPLGPISTGWQR